MHTPIKRGKKFPNGTCTLTVVIVEEGDFVGNLRCLQYISIMSVLFRDSIISFKIRGKKQ